MYCTGGGIYFLCVGNHNIDIGSLWEIITLMFNEWLIPMGITKGQSSLPFYKLINSYCIWTVWFLFVSILVNIILVKERHMYNVHVQCTCTCTCTSLIIDQISTNQNVSFRTFENLSRFPALVCVVP